MGTSICFQNESRGGSYSHSTDIGYSHTHWHNFAGFCHGCPFTSPARSLACAWLLHLDRICLFVLFVFPPTLLTLVIPTWTVSAYMFCLCFHPLYWHWLFPHGPYLLICFVYAPTHSTDTGYSHTHWQNFCWILPWLPVPIAPGCRSLSCAGLSHIDHICLFVLCSYHTISAYLFWFCSHPPYWHLLFPHWHNFCWILPRLRIFFSSYVFGLYMAVARGPYLLICFVYVHTIPWLLFGFVPIHSPDTCYSHTDIISAGFCLRLWHVHGCSTWTISAYLVHVPTHPRHVLFVCHCLLRSGSRQRYGHLCLHHYMHNGWSLSLSLHRLLAIRVCIFVLLSDNLNQSACPE